MNPKRLALAILLVFVGTFATDFLIHGLWLDTRYKETANLWRSETEMQAHMGWLMLGQFLFAATFCLLWAKGFAATACIRCACGFGACLGTLCQTSTLITYAVQPFPADIAVKWFVAGVVQGTLLGILAFFAYKPNPEPAAAT